MLMPGRNYTASDGYRYGFNGMEKDDEVKGSGNSYDFGARMYDPRVGRWFSVDPIVSEWEAPYSMARNSPIFLNDLDGRDARVSIKKNDGGGGVITVTTVVHVYGKNAKQVADYANEKVKSLNTSSTYVDEEGNLWTVNFDIKFKENRDLNELDPAYSGLTYTDAKEVEGVEAGDNILCSGCLPERGDLETAYGSKAHVIGEAQNAAETGVHAVFHNMGLTSHTQEKGDVLYEKAVIAAPITHVSQKHFDDIATGLINISSQEEINGISYPAQLNTDAQGNVNNEVISGENFSID